MKKVLTSVVALHIVIVLAGLSFAAMGGGKAGELKIPKRAVGEVVVIDSQVKTITIGTKVNENIVPLVVVVDDNTSFAMGSEKKTFSDLKVGDIVMVKYLEVNGRNIAKLVFIEKK